MVKTCFIVPSLLIDAEKSSMLKNAIKSIEDTVEDPSIRVVISGDHKYIPDIDKKHIFYVVEKSGERLSYSKAVNLGLKKCLEEKGEWDFIIIYSDDVFAYVKNWHLNMFSAFDLVPGLKIVAACENGSYSDILRISWISFHGACWGAKPETFEEIGFLDERYSIGTFDDTDYWVRVNSKGYLGAIVNSAPVHHIQSATFQKISEFDSAYQSNRKKFQEKWGFDVIGTYHYASIFCD